MKISVITACRDAATSIAHTLESFLAQDHAAKELLVLDGASTDGTQDIVARYVGEGVTLRSERDRGMYDAINKGLRFYTGDAVGTLNADDAYHDRGVLRRVAEALGEADITYGDLDFVADHAGKRVVRRWRTAARPRRGFQTGWMPAHPTFYVRRAVVDRVGDYDITLDTASDYDFMLRAMELHGFSSRKVEGVMIDMMRGGRSTASLSSHLRHNFEARSSRRRWLDAPLVDRALVAKPARKLGQFFVR